MGSSLNLLTLVVDAFSKEEIRNICYELGLDYEEFPDAESGLVRELLIECEIRGTIPEMISICRRERPKQVWPDPGELMPKYELPAGCAF